MNFKALSLFANIGVAEAYLKEMGIDVVLANEIDEKRASLYSHLYPETEMVCGDITDEEVRNHIIKKAWERNVEVILATPPCQGMSTAGKQESDDARNELITDAVAVIRKVKPKYVLLENVPMQMKTKIRYQGRWESIPDYIERELSNDYGIVKDTVNVCDYGVAQTRERAIFLLSKKTEGRTWDFPKKEGRVKTLWDAIGHLPILDPYIKDATPKVRQKLFPRYEERKLQASEFSKWHVPPVHVYRQVLAMMHTATGQSALENKKYYPKKKNGIPVKGYPNTYKRQRWDMPAYTITMYNRTISSQNNVHPGRWVGRDDNGDDLYSDPRVLTLYELMLVMSLPKEWNLPEHVSEAYLRSIIGEGIPPLFVKKLFERII